MRVVRTPCRKNLVRRGETRREKRAGDEWQRCDACQLSLCEICEHMYLYSQVSDRRAQIRATRAQHTLSCAAFCRRPAHLSTTYEYTLEFCGGVSSYASNAPACNATPHRLRSPTNARLRSARLDSTRSRLLRHSTAQRQHAHDLFTLDTSHCPTPPAAWVTASARK